VEVVKQQAFHPAIVEQVLAACLDHREIVLVHDLVGLHVEAPVAAAVIERHIGQLTVGPRPQLLIPAGLDDADARVADRLHPLARGVVGIALSEGKHELIHDRQDGEDRLSDRVVILDRVPGERKT
jgi:hypothetical protein